MWLAVAPAYAADIYTVNESAGAGVSGKLLSSAPATCMADPGTVDSGGGWDGTLNWSACGYRGAKAVEAMANHTYFGGDDFSDLKERLIREYLLLGDTLAVATTKAEAMMPTDIGSSWLPNMCVGPDCGHIMRGDAIEAYWIDADADGKGDRMFVEQFSWGETSVVANPDGTRNVSNLSVMQGDKTRTVPGATRMQVRKAMGMASYQKCDGNLFKDGAANPDCFDGQISSKVNDVNAGYAHPYVADDNVVTQEDVRVWGKCDPDRFDPAYSGADDIIDWDTAQYAFNLCMARMATVPMTSPVSGSDQLPPGIDPALASDIDPILGDPYQEWYQRDTWMTQAVRKDVETQTADAQDFYQSMLAAAGFLPSADPADTTQAVYANDWRLTQGDLDPNPTLNGHVSDPAAPNNRPSSADTYTYTFEMAVSSLESAQLNCNNLDGVDAATFAKLCTVGITNDTIDPFFGVTVVRDANGNPLADVAGDVVHDYMRLQNNGGMTGAVDTIGDDPFWESGSNISFMYAQTINGYLSTCLNCDSPELLDANAGNEFDPYLQPPTFIPYDSAWNTIPTVQHADNGIAP